MVVPTNARMTRTTCPSEEVLRSAKQDGVDWRALYEVAKGGQPSRYPEPPELGLVDPKR